MTNIRVCEDIDLGEGNGLIVYIGKRVELTLSCHTAVKEFIRALKHDGIPSVGYQSYWRDGDWINYQYSACFPG